MEDHLEPPTKTGTNPYVSGPSGYAFSGKIMLTAIVVLFAIILIMICIHIYARWYILRARRRRNRRTHLIFHIDSLHNRSNTPAKGLDPTVLNSLPTSTFSTAENLRLECAVCLSEFNPGEELRLLPKCNHSFHVECIDMWFHSHATCPLCRSPVEAGDVVIPEVVVESTRGRVGVVGESTRGVGPSGSFNGRRKVGVECVVVPKRSQSFCFVGGGDSDESGPSRSPGFKSPTSRILSFKRILSREKKSPLGSPSGAGPSWAELDVELGRVDSSSQVLTPR